MRVEPIRPPLTGPIASVAFVGRKLELERLCAGMEEAFAGRGKLFTLVGDPGIGKTRTAEELAAYARVRSAPVLVGRCHESEGAPAYWPWVQIIRAYIEKQDAARVKSAMGLGASSIAQVVSEVREMFTDLPSLAPSTEAEQARFLLFDSITTFFKNAASAAPLVLILDDLHWADKSSLLLLQFLAREIASSRVLIVATYREVEVQRGHPLAEILPSLRRERVYERILLRGLGENDVRALLAALGGEEMPQAFSREIYRETEGNPFFVGEILRHLVEERILYREQGRWTSQHEPEEMGIPESVREVVGRRLNRLSERCHEVLAIGSVIGREFSSSALEGVSRLGTEELQDRLEEALAARVIVELPPSCGRYGFSHAVIRETLYAELQTSRRLELHRRVADVLEGAHADDADTLLAELSHHLFAAAAGGGDAAKAADYAERAGDRADRQVAHAEAVAHYERALQLFELGTVVGEDRRIRLLLSLGENGWKAGEFDKARAAFRTVARAAAARRDPDLLARAALGFGGPFSNFNIFALEEELIGLLRQALELFPEEDSSIRARLLARLAGALHHTESKPQLVSLAHQAIDMARRIADPTTLAYVLNHARYPLGHPANLGERMEMTGELLRLAEDTGDSAMVLNVRYYRVTDLIEGGDFAGADTELAVMARLAEQVRQPHPVWRFTTAQVTRATMEGRLEDAERFAARALELRGGSADQTAAGIYRSQMVVIRREQGRLAELAPAWKAAAERSPHFYIAQCLLAWIQAETGEHGEARKQLDRLVPESPTEWRHDLYSLGSLWMLTSVCAAVGDERRAAVLYAVALPYANHFAVAAGAGWFGGVSGILGILASIQGLYDDAARHFERALEMNRTKRLWLGWTEYDYAQMLLSRGDPADRDKALLLLSDALSTAGACGLKLLLERALALKMKAEGIADADVKTSIEAVTDSLEAKQPDLRSHAAPDGTVTLLFSDMEGFSTMTERLGDSEAHKVIQAHNRIVREQVNAYGGYEVEVQGDGFLLAFPGAGRALQCAIAIQRAFAAYADEHPEQPIRVRMGLHTGEPIKDADRFFGKTVILAARIAGQARGGEIFVSAVVEELAEASGMFAFDDGHEVRLKGLEGTHRIFGVCWDGSTKRRERAPHAAPRASGCVFSMEGDSWTIAYAGKSVRLRDMKGLHCIAHLLRHPGQELHVADLAIVSDASDASRKVGDTTERTRKAVTGRIRESLAKIQKEHPDLGLHFANAIRTGTFCSYNPEKPAIWQL
jgi:class 3 adenylate cyclase